MLKLTLFIPSVVKKLRLLQSYTWSFIKQMYSKEHFSSVWCEYISLHCSKGTVTLCGGRI